MIIVEKKANNGSISAITIQGHAGYAEKGKDLVCAAISSIATGALNALDELCPEECDLICDDALIQMCAVKESHDNQLILKAVWIQIATVAESYPDFIQLKEV